MRWKHGLFVCLGAILGLVPTSCKDPVEVEKGVDAGEGMVEAGKNGGFLLVSDEEKSRIQARELSVSPEEDGWESESWHERSNTTLKELGNLIVEGGKLDRFIANDLENGGANRGFWPVEPDVAYESLQVKVRQTTGESRSFEGEGCRLALKDLQRRASGGWIRFKQHQIDDFAKNRDSFGTKVFVWVGYTGGESDHLIEMAWSVDWAIVGELPLIEKISLERWQEVKVPKEKRWFRDRSELLLGNLEGYRQLQRGGNAWIKRIPGDSGRRLQGITLGDLNGDGWDDVFCPQAEGLPNLIYVSGPDGQLREQGKEWGLDWLDDTVSALIVDFDNDGDQDLVVGLVDHLVFVRNQGPGRGFETSQGFVQDDCSALGAADYDGDGLLDLFVGNYLGVEASTVVVKPDQVYDATNGSLNRMYRNEGDFVFREVTKETGLDKEASRLALAVSWEDFDNDGDQDLYVANDFGPNCLYRNDGGLFTEVAGELGANDPSTGMSVAWGDPNGDGRMDVLIGNMFSAAGNRVTRQTRFKNELTTGLDVEKVRYLARGNSLLLSNEEGFRERAAENGVLNTQWTWSMLMADINNDGWEDVLALNGYITGKEADDL